MKSCTILLSHTRTSPGTCDDFVRHYLRRYGSNARSFTRTSQEREYLRWKTRYGTLNSAIDNCETSTQLLRCTSFKFTNTSRLRSVPAADKGLVISPHTKPQMDRVVPLPNSVDFPSPRWSRVKRATPHKTMLELKSYFETRHMHIWHWHM